MSDLERSPLNRRLAAGDLIIATFVKTPSPIVVEVLGMTGLDCFCLDAEHAPFERGTLDTCLLAARACRMDVLVRVPSPAPKHTLNALDCGATGILVPHVRSASEARASVRAGHYGAGGHGYVGSSRAAAYASTPMTEYLAESARRTVVVAEIEDPEAIDDIEAIAAEGGVDALFVGRVDLIVGYGASSLDDPRVVAALELVCAAGRRAGKPVGMFLSSVSDVAQWRAKGRNALPPQLRPRISDERCGRFAARGERLAGSMGHAGASPSSPMRVIFVAGAGGHRGCLCGRVVPHRCAARPFRPGVKLAARSRANERSVVGQRGGAACRSKILVDPVARPSAPGSRGRATRWYRPTKEPSRPCSK